MTPRHGKSYIWVTWISGLLAGTSKCAWPAWCKAHYQLPKGKKDPEDQARLDAWCVEHDAMTSARVPKLQAEGWTVTVEDANSFQLVGQTAILSGKPDIVAVRKGNPNSGYVEPEFSAIIVDEKSGKEKAEHIWQVKIYIWVLSLIRLKNYTIWGEIEHHAKFIPVHPEPGDMEAITRMVKLVGGKDAPPTVPSAGECRFCDFNKTCKDAFKAEQVDAAKFF